MTEPIAGVIERITFHNRETGYCVLRVRVRGQADPVTVVGHCPEMVVGESIEAAGTWVTDREHGLQFKAQELKTTPPQTTAGIAKYLGSGLVKGIGPGFAKRIVDTFGDKTLEVIDQSPAFLTQVKGIGPKLIEKIRKSWQEQVAVRKIMVFLHSYGIGTARAIRIHREYGDRAIELIKANPYRLSADIWGVGFQTADELALRLGLARDSPARAQAAVRHVLREESGNGHVCYPEDLLIEQAVRLTEISPDGIGAAIRHLRESDEIVIEVAGSINRPTHSDERGDESTNPPLVYLKSLYLAETGVARQLTELLRGPHPLAGAAGDVAADWVERKMGISFSESQRQAVRASVARKVIVVTGGPGTGKTTIVRGILEIFLAKGLRVSLCAPTGRAAKRLSESTGREARTVHRLLDFDPAIGSFRRTRDHPLDIDLLIVDEVSMVDISLMHLLLRAVPPWACLVLVGDRDQLPSVGPGAVLADVIDSGVVPVARLIEIHRQAGASWIIRAAHAVNHGQLPESAPASDGDFFFIPTPDPAAVIERMIQMVKVRIPQRFGLDPTRDIQVLSPQVKTELGVLNLNKELQTALNPGGAGIDEVKRADGVFRVGDKVIQTRNNYQREVFNGDIGRVEAIDPAEQVLTVVFDGRRVDYDFADLDELNLAYCVSIHKSQGSEYPAVVIVLHTQHYVMLQRNLLYTAITRGRKLVAVVGSPKALWRGVTNHEKRLRYSLLGWRLSSRDWDRESLPFS